MFLQRYSTLHSITSPLDPIEDVLTLIEQLCATEYLIEVLRLHHLLSVSDAKKRAALIKPHLHAAITFLKQGDTGPREVSYLPLYYAILNFLKICVLTGTHHTDLETERWHGAMYKVDEKDSRSLLTDKITLKRRGALSLFYSTVTGSRFPKDYEVSMADVYPYIESISAEYTLATNHKGKICRSNLSLQDDGKGKKLVVLRIDHDTPAKANELKAFTGFRARQPGEFISSPLPDPAAADMFIKNHVRKHLLYLPDREDFPPYALADNNTLRTPISGKRLQLPEELPIALAFFHLSSVVRYKPYFFEKIMQSKYSPLIVAIRRHAIFSFLRLFWSHMHKRCLLIRST